MEGGGGGKRAKECILFTIECGRIPLARQCHHSKRVISLPHGCNLNSSLDAFSVSLRASACGRHPWSLRESQLSSFLLPCCHSHTQRNEFVLVLRTENMKKKTHVSNFTRLLSSFLHVRSNDEIKLTEPLWMEQCDLRVKLMHIGIVHSNGFRMRHAHSNASLVFISISKIIMK